MRAGAAAIAVLSVAVSISASGGDTRPPSALAGSITTHVVRQGDSLRSVGARAGIDLSTLARDNRLSPKATLLVGERLRIDNRHIVPVGVERGALIINIPQRMIFHLGDDGVLDAFPVAVGRRSWPTPAGAFTVTAKETQPTWDVPRSIREEALRLGRSLPLRVPPGPHNPLGAFWIGLNVGGVGVHGTNAPGSIYSALSHGCIRLHPDDIARLFPRVAMGAAGRIIYEPVLLAAEGQAVFLEVHRDVYGRLADGLRERARALAATSGLTDRIDWTIADAVLAAHDGIARDVSTREVAPQ